MMGIDRWEALSLFVLLAACGGDSSDRGAPTSRDPEVEANTDVEADADSDAAARAAAALEAAIAAADPLPLLAAHPAPPPLPPPGCRVRDADGSLGELVPGLDFRVTLRAGRGRVHQGQRVRLALSFTAREPDTFQLDAAEYDRGGRLGIDQYEVEPTDGTVDPLADYYDRGQMFGGGIRQMPMLGRRPTVVERELDEYVQFRRPGRYLLRVATDRVSRDGDSIVCATDAIALEILPPDDAANARSVRDALAVFARDASRDPEAGRSDAEEEALGRASRTLRFLGTEAAAEAIVELLVSPNGELWGGELTFGLWGSPHRERVVALMREALVKPDASITPSFFDALVRLTAQLERPGYIPPWPDDEPSRLRWRHTEALYLAHRREVEGRYATSLLGSLSAKRGAANDATFMTLLEVAFDDAHEPAWLDRLRAEIGARLPTMDDEALRRFLHDRWSQIADASLVGPLTAMADADATEPDARALALSRLVELAPTPGQTRIEAEIRRVPSRLGYRSREVMSLLVGPLPALDDALAAGVERQDYEQDLRAHLLARYGSAAIAPRVRRVLAARTDRSSSEAEGAYIAYLLRVDHDAEVRELDARGRAPGAGARSPLAPDIEQRMFGAQLASAASYLWDPVIERQLVALLASDDPVTVTNAAQVLRAHGTAAVERALWARLEVHHARFEHRVSEANRGEPWQIEDALVSALWQGRGWHLDHAGLERLLGLCLAESTTNNIRAGVEQDGGVEAVTVFLQEDGTVMAHVDRYHFSSAVEPLRPATVGAQRHFVLAGSRDAVPRGARRVRAEALDDLLIKLAQLPRDTTLQLSTLPDDSDEARALRASLVRWMGAHGLHVAR